jgi:hypothetical protein
VLTEIIMLRALLITASCFALGACANFSIPEFKMPSLGSSAPVSTLEFESEPPGAEVRTSTGQTCRTPCSLSVAASEMTATFTLNGYQPQSVPVKTVTTMASMDTESGEVPVLRLTPNPVYVELMLAPPARKVVPPPAVKPAPQRKPVAAKPKPPVTPMTSAPASAPPPSPWPSSSPAR